MFRTAPNFSNIRNRVPAHILRPQTFDIVAVFVRKYKRNSPPKKPSLLWGSPVSRLPSAVEFRSNDHHWAAGLYCTRTRPWIQFTPEYPFKFCHVTLCHVTFCHIMSPYNDITLYPFFHFISRDVTLCYVTLCCVTLCNVALCKLSTLPSLTGNFA